MYNMFTYKLKNYLFKNKGLLEITASHVHCKCGNILETGPDSVVVTTDY